MRRIVRTALLGTALVAFAGGCGDDDDMALRVAMSADDGNWAGGGGAGMPGEGSWQEGENYTSYGENEFTDPAEDHLLTFGVDVDTASYTIMRRDVNAGALPVSEGVRTEEYLNYFDYLYQPPAEQSEDAFAIHLDGAPSTFGEGLQLLRVGIKGKELAAPERGPANLVFLVDVSGSMSSADKLGLVKTTLRLLVNELRADDTIGLVTYASDPRVVLEPTPVAERETVLAAIDSLYASGSTNGEGGIRAAYDLAEKSFRQDGINRVVLCTDGDLNVGLTGDALIELIETFRSRGIYLTTLGFGRGNYNDADMEQLADKGNGNYAYVDSAAEAERVMRRELLGTLVVIAKDVKIQVEFNQEAVARYRLLGYENRAIDDEDFEDPDVDTGDIGAGHDVTALVELELKPEVEDPGAIPATIATARVRYKHPTHDGDTEVVREITAADLATAMSAAPESLRFAAAVAEYAEILRHSSFSEGDRFDEVIELAQGATAEGDPDRLEFIELVGKAKSIWQSRFGQ